ncbi:MAG: ThuA domain-containing protein [Acidimicrobiia bacterium]|nr:ThuA domain-containing protein [Acidimicrobiia bacterium]
MSDQPGRVTATLMAAGKYHDIDYARLELLRLFAEHEHLRVRVVSDFEDADAIADSDFLVSYACDVRPSEPAQHAIRAWIEGGGRWLALHGTNAALDIGKPTGVESPRCFPVWADTLGSQFVAHPPIAPFPVVVADPDHWLVSGIEGFETDDELYLCEYHDRDRLVPLLETQYNGDATGFAESDWSATDPRHLVQYLRPLGEGAVLYNNLGHCRGHYDMIPLTDYYPQIERCSWEIPQYQELLRRGIRWAMRLEPRS